MTEPGQPSKAQRLVEGLSERRERHKERGRVYRIAVVAAGVVVLLAGLAMTVLPGPAIVVIPIGLSLLALEFVWAEQVLERVAKGADFALSRRPPRKAWLAAAAVLVATAATILIVNAA
jgi:uncharacterized protein (TIGR02611 family)